MRLRLLCSRGLDFIVGAECIGSWLDIAIFYYFMYTRVLVQ